MQRIKNLIQIQQSLMTQLDTLDLTQIDLEKKRDFLETLCKHLTTHKNEIKTKLFKTHLKLSLETLQRETQ